jgi:acyl carrier protein
LNTNDNKAPQMQHSEVVEALLEMLSSSLEESRQLSSESALIADAGLESIQVIEYLCEVEDRFDLIIDEVSLADVSTVGELAEVVLRLRGPERS